MFLLDMLYKTHKKTTKAYKEDRWKARADTFTLFVFHCIVGGIERKDR